MYKAIITILLVGTLFAQEPKKVEVKVISLATVNKILKAENDLAQLELTKAKAESQFQQLKSMYNEANAKVPGTQKTLDAAIEEGKKECGDGFNLDPANFTCLAKPKDTASPKATGIPVLP